MTEKKERFLFLSLFKESKVSAQQFARQTQTTSSKREKKMEHIRVDTRGTQRKRPLSDVESQEMQQS